MGVAWFRLYGQLNDFVAAARRGRRFRYALQDPLPVGDAIDAIGVPRAEIDLVVVNGTPVDFSHLLHDGDRIAVYPPFQSIDLGDVQRANR